jgi:hypothetical protein
LTYYTATKNSFTLPEITIGQDKIHGLSAQQAFTELTELALRVFIFLAWVPILIPSPTQLIILILPCFH